MDDKQQTILILEDDNFLSGLAADRAQKEGYNVITKANGEEALEELKTTKPDIILIDLMLPGMSGFEFLGALKSDDSLKDIKTIIFSNLGDEKDITKGKELGADDYAVKASLTLAELVEKVKTLLAQPSAESAPQMQQM